jgi:hypothetical protein
LQLVTCLPVVAASVSAHLSDALQALFVVVDAQAWHLLPAALLLFSDHPNNPG